MKGRFEFESEASYDEYLRTYFSGMALQGYLASYAQEDWTNDDANIKHTAQMSVLYADELIKALRKAMQ